MKKKIACKEVEEIELEFANGEIIPLRFDASAAIALNDIEGGLNAIVQKGVSITDMCARIIYAGSVSSNKEMSYEKARAIVSNLSLITITEIINVFNESMGITSSEEQLELQKKTMAQFLQKIAK